MSHRIDPKVYDPIKVIEYTIEEIFLSNLDRYAKKNPPYDIDNREYHAHLLFGILFMLGKSRNIGLLKYIILLSS